MKGLGATPGALRLLALGLALAAVAAVVLGMAGGAGAGDPPRLHAAVDAGFDLFETDPEQTVFRFRDETAIPADFFGPGSQPFTGAVQFGGVPLEKFQNKDSGDADTVVQRMGAANVPAPGSSSGQIPIEIVALNLISIQPIQVRVGSETQTWDVRAALSPSRESTGHMAIDRTSAEGGTFDSQFKVYPKFTFTRLSDRQTKVLDVGALPDGQRPSVTLRADDTKWRDGCVRPALLIRGLNDNFCPALTTEEQKELTAEEARSAHHGIRPVQPMLEHFKCYAGLPLTKLAQRNVTLTDQFGQAKVKVLRHDRLCNPVRKNKERFGNKDAHLHCYVTTGKAPKPTRQLLIRNQFGPFTAKLGKPNRLCVPSSKQTQRGKAPPKDIFFTDHFQCYGIKPRGTFQKRTVRLRDQFVTQNVAVQKPFRICAPAQKNEERANHPVQHLVCYRFKSTQLQRVVIVRNQFGRQLYQTAGPRELCLPSLKVANPPPPPRDPPLDPPFDPPTTQQPKRTLNVFVNGPGSVTGPGINCSGMTATANDCNEIYDEGTGVTLTPNGNHQNWGGDCAGTPQGQPCKLTMNADRNVGAQFGT